MSSILVRHHKNVSDGVLDLLSDELQAAVVSAFDCDDPGGSLTVMGIELYFTEMTDRDHTTYPIIIDVEVLDTPQRQNLIERVLRLGEYIRAITGPYEFVICPKLVKAYRYTSDGV